MTETESPAADDHRALRPLQGQVEFVAMAAELLTAARSQVRILAQAADLGYLAHGEVVEALRALIRGSRRTRIELLLPPAVARDERGRALWDLAQRLTSFIGAHRLADEDAQLSEAWLTVDGRGYLYRSQAERLRGEGSLLAPGRVRDLDERFAALWRNGAPDPDLRRLHV